MPRITPRQSLVILSLGASLALTACSSSTPNSGAVESSPTATVVTSSATPTPSHSPSATPTSVSPSPTPSAVPTVTVVEESPSSAAAEDATESRDQVSNAVSAVDAESAAGPEAQSALDTLNTLEVKGRAPKTGYSRDQFGQAWADVDHNGCDTRNDIFARDLTSITYKAGSRACVVASGILNDPYTGSVINFVRGNDTSTAVQIDHIVAISDAWQSGAQNLSEEQREQIANDPINLLAVDGPTNQQKSDGDAAAWLPPNKSYRCTYVSKQIEVKAKYGLWVKQAEKDAMINILSSCGAVDNSQPVQEETPAATQEAQEPAPAQQVTQAPAQEAPANGGDVYYQNCKAAKAAGAAPLYRGQPGYREKMDGDGDGVACEK